MKTGAFSVWLTAVFSAEGGLNRRAKDVGLDDFKINDEGAFLLTTICHLLEHGEDLPMTYLRMNLKINDISNEMLMGGNEIWGKLSNG